jgi:drug/metabolite transporter (DMT)-like permease
MILILILNILWAATFTIGKASLSYTTPILFIGMRMFIGGLMLLAYCLIKKEPLKLRKADMFVIAQVCFFQYYTSFICEYWSMNHIASSKASLLFNLSPFITAIISYFALNELITKKQLVGLIVGFLGFIPILMAAAPEENILGGGGLISIPEIVMIMAVFSSCYGWIAFKKAHERGYGTLTINAWTMFLAGIASLITSILVEGTPTINAPATCYSLAGMQSLCDLVGTYGAGIIMFAAYTLAIILIANIAAFNLHGYLLHYYTATFISFTGFIIPMFSALFGWFFLSEQIGMAFWISTVVVSIGLYIFYQDELRTDKLDEPPVSA